MKINFYTATEAARKIGVSKELVARYCREKRISDCVRKGRVWLIPGKALVLFQDIQRGYRPGRPRKTQASVFWRERRRPEAPDAIQILATRTPSLIPRLYSKDAAHSYIRSGRTRLERIVRKAMVEGLYDQVQK